MRPPVEVSLARNAGHPEPTYPLNAVAEDLAQFFDGGPDESVVYEISRCPEFDTNRRVCAALDAVVDAEQVLADARSNALRVAAAEARDLVAAWMAYNHARRAIRSLSLILVWAGVHSDEQWLENEFANDQPAEAWRAFVASGLAWEFRRC